MGTRIHGTIASIIAGTPAHLFIHDSRTKELADYFEIPYSSIQNIKDIDISQLYEKSDYTGLVKNHKKRFDVIVDFLNKHDLDNIFEKENRDILLDYENRYQSTVFEQNVKPINFSNNTLLIKRVKFLYKELKK
jgi:hypothetical protein